MEGSPFVRHQHGQLCLKVKPLQCTVAGFVRGGEDDGLCPRQGVIPCGIPKKRRKRPVLHQRARRQANRAADWMGEDVSMDRSPASCVETPAARRMRNARSVRESALCSASSSEIRSSV